MCACVYMYAFIHVGMCVCLYPSIAPSLHYVTHSPRKTIREQRLIYFILFFILLYFVYLFIFIFIYYYLFYFFFPEGSIRAVHIQTSCSPVAVTGHRSSFGCMDFCSLQKLLKCLFTCTSILTALTSSNVGNFPRLFTSNNS